MCISLLCNHYVGFVLLNMYNQIKNINEIELGILYIIYSISVIGIKNVIILGLFGYYLTKYKSSRITFLCNKNVLEKIDNICYNLINKCKYGTYIIDKYTKYKNIYDKIKLLYTFSTISIKPR